MKWIYLSGIVGGTVCADLLQSHGMRNANGRRWKLPLSIFFMAISFFSFTQLLRIAPLSFAVPASAASIAIDTLLARLVLHEHIELRRWAGAILVAGGVVLLAQ
ncbi:MAG: EamA family transporter [Bryobacteraceae bacterium]|jgi:drug/metabolite transporter (DMT)-like permease